MLKNLLGLTRRNETPENSYYKAIKAYKNNPQQDFSRLRAEIGLAAATEYAHIYFSNLKTNLKFKRELEIHSFEYNQLNSQVDVIIVPPPRALISDEAYKRYIKPLSALVTSCGFAHVSILDLKVDSVLEGARGLHKQVQEKIRGSKKFIIISTSYGSGIVRTMMDHASQQELSAIKGWINLSGLIFGSPRFHCSDKTFWPQKNSRLQRSFSSEQTYFLSPFKDYGIRTVHFLGLQLGSEPSENRSEREFLKAWGPNDGLVPFYRYQNLSQPVVSFANEGHWISIVDHASLFVKTLSSMVSVIPVDKRALTIESIESEIPEITFI